MSEQNNSIDKEQTENQKYIVVQVNLKDKFFKNETRNLKELEDLINSYANKGYRLHTCTTDFNQGIGVGNSFGGNGDFGIGFMGSTKIRATLIFEKL